MGLSNNNAFGSVLAQGHWKMRDPRQGQGAVIKLVDIFPHVFYANMILLLNLEQKN